MLMVEPLPPIEVLYPLLLMLIASPGAIRILLRNLNPICYSCSQECDGAGPLYGGFMAEIDF